jgi:nucleoid DNA-binding protein
MLEVLFRESEFIFYSVGPAVSPFKYSVFLKFPITKSLPSSFEYKTYPIAFYIPGFLSKGDPLKEAAMASKSKRMSKTEFIEAVANESGLDKKQVNAVLDGLTGVIYKELKNENEVVIPGLVKLTTVKKPAVPEREGINPFTKEKTTFKARPARTVIKPRPLKALKDAI